MSAIDDVFSQSRIEFGLQQKPNWSGTVYGVCMTKGCANYRKIGYYEGGFCKKCSLRHPDDLRKHVLASTVDSSGMSTQIPNPRVRWIRKIYVKDLSNKLSGSEREEFYMTPEERQRRFDRTNISTKNESWDSDIIEPPKQKKPKKDEDDDWII